MDGGKYPERRRFKRVKVNFMIIYRVEEPVALRVTMGIEKEMFALMLDLCEEGMGIITDYNIPSRTILFIKFALIDLDSLSEKFIKMDILGKVMYNLSLEKKEYRLGIHFERIEPNHRLNIRNFVERMLVNQIS